MLGTCLRLSARQLLGFRFELGVTPPAPSRGTYPDAPTRICVLAGMGLHRTHQVALDDARQRAAALNRYLYSDGV